MILIILSASNINMFTIVHANNGYTSMGYEIQKAISTAPMSNEAKEQWIYLMRIQNL